MQKRKLLIMLFIAITALCLISMSAQCSIGEAPEVELEIYDGPDYSESDNMCYYRIEAIVSGTPDPEIEFDTDDNVSSLGRSRVEVGVEIGDSYILTVTATNIAGTSTASIILSSECVEEIAEEGAEVAEEEEEAEVSEEEVETEAGDADADGDDDGNGNGDEDEEGDTGDESELMIVVPTITTRHDEFHGDDSKSGYIRDDGFVNYEGYALIGDDAIDDEIDRDYKGYLSFDISSISSLEDVTIIYAEVEIHVSYIGYPWLVGDKLHIKVYHYGDTLDYPEDFREGGESVITFNTSETLDDLSFSNDKLKSELQKTVDARQSDFQLKLGLSGPDNSYGFYRFTPRIPKLIVEYEIPAS